MTDRELLEWAAKAVGYTCIYIQSLTGTYMVVKELNSARWNPLEDDGDALRLAVKLKMVVDTDYNGGAIAGNAVVSCDYDLPEYGYQEGMGKREPYAATRRAIVRAAAEIGKEMK